MLYRLLVGKVKLDTSELPSSCRSSSKTGCAPRSVKKMPSGEPRKSVCSGSNGMICVMGFVNEGPQEPLVAVAAPSSIAYAS